MTDQTNVATIEAVFDAIDGEREYQRDRWGADHREHQHDVAEFVVFMRQYHSQVVMRATKEDGWGGALDEIRKVAALGVACMERHGVGRGDDRSPTREFVYSQVRLDAPGHLPIRDSLGRHVILIGEHISAAEKTVAWDSQEHALGHVRSCVVACVCCMMANGVVKRVTMEHCPGSSRG